MSTIDFEPSAARRSGPRLTDAEHRELDRKASAYDQFGDWEAVEVEQRRRAREARELLANAQDRATLFEMRAYLAEQCLAAALSLLVFTEFERDQAWRVVQAMRGSA